jgi:hypothetical protein
MFPPKRDFMNKASSAYKLIKPFEKMEVSGKTHKIW